MSMKPRPTPSLTQPGFMAARRIPHTMKPKLLKAVATGDADLLVQCLGGVWWSTERAEEGDENCLEGVTAEGSSALHIAASHGCLELVVMICTEDVSLVKELIEARNNQLDTPLICAARAGHAGIVRYLIDRALTIHEARAIVMPAGAVGTTAMHEAVRNGHASVLRELMSKDRGLAKVVDKQGVSPLYLAVVSDRPDMVDILIGESSDGVKSPASYAGPDGQTALHAAVYANNAQKMTESLQRWEPSLAEKKDIYGRTALHYAASAGEIGVVKLLLMGNDLLAYIPDNDGQFPVHSAAMAGRSTEVIREFMNMCPTFYELVDNKSRNVLHYAVEHGRFKVVWYIRRNQNFVRMVNAGDSEGNTPLHLAVKHGHVMVLSLLTMDIRVNLGIINHERLTPLDIYFNGIPRNYSFSALMNGYIGLCLTLCEAYTSQNRPHGNMADKLCLENEESDSQNSVSESISYISVLIATGSFAAAFSPPKYSAGGEIAEFGGKRLFLSHVLSNTMSFYFSTLATCLLLHARLTTTSITDRRLHLARSALLVYVAVIFASDTFMNVVQLALGSPESMSEYVLFYTFKVLEVVPWCMLFFPVSISSFAVFCRVAMQLVRRRKRSCKDTLKALAALVVSACMTFAAVPPAVMVVSLIEVALSDGEESCGWHGCAVHGDAKYSYPT